MQEQIDRIIECLLVKYPLATAKPHFFEIPNGINCLRWTVHYGGVRLDYLRNSAALPEPSTEGALTRIALALPAFTKHLAKEERFARAEWRAQSKLELDEAMHTARACRKAKKALDRLEATLAKQD